jgi:23S rRNA (cytosine1962-C5)-methyltransferase
MAKRLNVSAYRLYDRDIPEFPYIVEVFNDYAVVSLRLKAIDEEETKKLNYQEFLKALEELGFPSEKRVFKKRVKTDASEQYSKNKEKPIILTIQEGQLQFQVNLNQYLDTGLFLDHRPWRQNFQELNLERKKYLNLFCYTGSLSVALAKAGATVTSVDLSKTYLEWAKTNFKLNGIDFNKHEFIQEDCIGFLKELEDSSFDGIVIDPPTFSVSKKFKGTFDVERDHSFLIRQSNKALKKDGKGFFSNNLRSFKLDEQLQERYAIKDISFQSIPEDFHDKKIHQAFSWVKPQ